MINLLIASNQVMFHHALEHVIRVYNKEAVVESVENCDHFFERTLETYFDLIIIDLNIDCRTGIEMLFKKNEKSLNNRVLVVSLPPDEFLLKAMIDANIKGFLSLSADEDEYILALDSMLHKGRYVSPEFTFMMVYESAHFLNGNLHDNLSKRESQVMLMIAQGHSIKEIATHLNLSDKTIGTYKARLLQKMRFNNTAQLIKYAIGKKIV